LDRLGRNALGVSVPRAVLVAGCSAVVVLWMGMRQSALEGFPLFLSKVISNIPMCIVYVGKTFAPFALSPMPGVTPLGLGLGTVSVVCVLALTWLSRDRLRGLFGVGLVWYGAFLFPAVLAPLETRGLEHRLYVPMIGMALVLANARWPARLESAVRVRRIALALVFVVFAGLTLARLPDYREPVAFWESAAEQSPRPAATLKTLSIHYYKADRLEEAEAACRRALSMKASDLELRALLDAIAIRRSEQRG
jgi:hypothetical protein